MPPTHSMEPPGTPGAHLRDPGPLCHGKMALTTPAMGRLSMTNGSQNLGLGFGQRELILTTPAMGHQFMLDKSCGHMCHVEGILTTPKGHAHMTHMTTKIAVAGCVLATFLPKNGFFDGTNSSRLSWTQANQSAAKIEIYRICAQGLREKLREKLRCVCVCVCMCVGACVWCVWRVGPTWGPVAAWENE